MIEIARWLGRWRQRLRQLFSSLFRLNEDEPEDVPDATEVLRARIADGSCRLEELEPLRVERADSRAIVLSSPHIPDALIVLSSEDQPAPMLGGEGGPAMAWGNFMSFGIARLVAPEGLRATLVLRPPEAFQTVFAVGTHHYEDFLRLYHLPSAAALQVRLEPNRIDEVLRSCAVAISCLHDAGISTAGSMARWLWSPQGSPAVWLEAASLADVVSKEDRVRFDTACKADTEMLIHLTRSWYRLLGDGDRGGLVRRYRNPAGELLIRIPEPTARDVALALCGLSVKAIGRHARRVRATNLSPEVVGLYCLLHGEAEFYSSMTDSLALHPGDYPLADLAQRLRREVPNDLHTEVVREETWA